MSETVRVVAAKGIQVPREDNPRRYISDSAEEELPLTEYYRRRLLDGDLVEIPPTINKSGKKADELADKLTNEHPWLHKEEV